MANSAFTFVVEDWGLIDYAVAAQKQKDYVAKILAGEMTNRLIFCEHPTVITIGRGGNAKQNIRATEHELYTQHIDVIEVNRGGDVTLHSPGQLVGYTLFNLTTLKTDLHWFLRQIEQCVIDTLAVHSILSHRIEGLTGIWVEESRKICAIGLGCRQWVTSHGFALNVYNSIDEFAMIVPCGIKEKSVTSMKTETGQHLELNSVKSTITQCFKENFGVIQNQVIKKV